MSRSTIFHLIPPAPIVCQTARIIPVQEVFMRLSDGFRFSHDHIDRNIVGHAGNAVCQLAVKEKRHGTAL